MRILYIIPAFQHPTIPGSARHYYFIRELAQRHRITLLALLRTPVSPAARDEMSRYVERILTFEAGRAAEAAADNWDGSRSRLISSRIRRALLTRSAVLEMKKEFQRLVQQEAYDVVLFHGKDVFPVIEGCTELPIVADFCDATSMRMRQSLRYTSVRELPWSLLRYFRASRIDKRLARTTPHLAFISGRDCEAILGRSGGARIIPNGVELGYWRRRPSRPQPNCIAFTGVMSYPPNADGAFYLIDKILPLVRRSFPDAEVLIVGRGPAPALIERAEQCRGVTVTGGVEDMRPYFERAAVFAAPLRYGAGMQNKALEAMAMEVPVVTTPFVAAGLRIEGADKPPVLLAEGAEGFADRIVSLLKDERERTRLAALGRQFVERHFNWAAGAAMLEEMCREAVARSQSRSREP